MLGLILKYAGYIIGAYYTAFAFVLPFLDADNFVQNYYPFQLLLNIAPLVLFVFVVFILVLVISYLMMDTKKIRRVKVCIQI